MNLIARFSEAGDSLPTPLPVRYFAEYLGILGACSMVVERHYIDRNYIEEVAAYYSRCLKHYPNWCVRMHFFKEGLTEALLDEKIKSAAEGNVLNISSHLQNAYLGFIVVRPIRSAPIGTAVLRPPEDSEEAHFLTCRDYAVHLLGFKLRIRGLAFQQQDGGVAACATTAVWVTLQKLCHLEGARPPTTAAITEAAVRHFLAEGRPIPSLGLSAEQISEAYRAFDFAPAIFNASSDLIPVTLLVQIYARSGIPVLMMLQEEDEIGHAVAISGYKEELPPWPVVNYGEARIKTRNAAVGALYVHDDLIGPYCVARLLADNEAKRKRFLRKDRPKPNNALRLIVDVPEPPRGIERKVAYIAVPLYPKMRMTAHDLIKGTMSMVDLVGKVFPDPDREFGVELFFARAGEYLRELYDLNIPPNGLCELQKGAVLSRHIGVSRFCLDHEPLLDVIWDTTDVKSGVIGLVGLGDVDRGKVRQAGDILKVISV